MANAHCFEFLGSLTVVECFEDLLFTCLWAGCKIEQVQQRSTLQCDQVYRVAWTLSVQHLDAFDDLQRIANMGPDWLIHFGYLRYCFNAQALGRFNH